MARTASLVALARKIEKARAKLHAAVAAKQRELHDLDTALRRVLGIGGGTKTGNGRKRRAAGRRGGRRRGPKPGGAPRAGSLASAVVAVVAKGGGKPTSIADVIKGVKASGHRSKAGAKSRTTMIYNTLARLSKDRLIRKVGRGQYAAKV